MSPYRTRKAVGELLNKFSNLYHPTWLNEMGPARSIHEYVERVGLGQEYTTRRGSEWAVSALGLGQKWVDEVMEGSTRVNVSSPTARRTAQSWERLIRRSTPRIWLIYTHWDRQYLWLLVEPRLSKGETTRSLTGWSMKAGRQLD